MKRILSFLKKDAVLTAAWTLALLSMAAVPPSIRYISYLDLPTLGRDSRPWDFSTRWEKAF